MNTSEVAVHAAQAARSGADAVVSLDRVTKRFGRDVVALDGVSFAVTAGNMLVLLGPSGCGKSTALRLVAGLEIPDGGEVMLNGRRVAGGRTWVPPEARRVGMVFQDYALFPHLSVADNVGFPLTRISSKERRARVGELLDLVGLAGLGGRFPHQISGGQQQRVALARALAPQPSVVLLDEPFSNLDAALRKSMRLEVSAILRATGATAIFVTHDQEEAFSVADTVVMMERGQVVQTGTPREIYLLPRTRSVATFVGESSFIPGVARGDQVETALGVLPLARPAEGNVDVLIRPESVAVEPNLYGDATVEQVTYLGHDQIVQIRCRPGLTLLARTRPRLALGRGDSVHLAVTEPVIAFSR
jgi:iron(III) transport system ATP-binding protein